MKGTGENIMAWADMQRTAQSIYSAGAQEVSNAVSDVGNAYQEFLTGGNYSANGPDVVNMDIADSAYQVNPEYAKMDSLYAAQQQEKAELSKEYEPDIEP